jgi:Glycosyl transferase family, helical bundle domain
LTIIVAKYRSQLGGPVMFGSSGAHDLGYANAAVLIALMRKLINNGTITKDEATEMLDDAMSTLEPFAHISSIAAALRMISGDMKARVAA